MKTKYLLTALALAGGFAACTQEDVLVEQGNLQSKVIEKSLGKLTFNVTGDVESRMTGANWDNQDILGLMWFNPSYEVEGKLTDMGNGMLWANNPFYFVEGSQSDFASKTNVMEGTHIAYYPYQTAWGDDKLQQIAGKEYLNIYASAEQQTDLTDRYDWMREHTNMFSKVHELTGDKAGLSKTNEIAMKQFNNIITVTPEFKNMPADLTVTRYYFEANAAKVFPTKAIVDPYAGEDGEIWPRFHKDFLNGWTGFTQLDSIYDPQVMVKTVAVNYPEAVAYTDANGKGFGFTLLPVAEGDLKNAALTGYGAVSETAHGITLYAETNYGIIPVTEVTVRMGDKMDGAIEETATWNKIFYGADNCTIPTDWERYGLVGKAGYTIQTKAVFDFENIIPQTEFTCIGNNADLDAALERIATYKTLLGAKYDAATINLCNEVEFTTFGEDGDFWGYIDANDSEVDITVQGNGETVINWIGKHYLSKEIESVALNNATAAETRAAAEGVELPADHLFNQPWNVDGSLLLNGKHITSWITVKAGGYLKVNGSARYVQVEGLGEGLNLGEVTNLKVAENGKFTNGSTAATAETAPEIIINKLWNKGKVVNFTTIESVQENTESATIELKKAKGKNLFQIGEVAWDGDQKPAALRYNELPTIEESVKSIGKIFAKVATDASIDASQQSYQAGEDVLKAMENFANEVIISAAAVDFRNHTSVARRNCLYNVMYTNLIANGEVEFITDNRLTASVLLVRKMTVNKGKSLKLSNFNNELADFAYSVAAYIALSTELNAGSTLYINGQTVLVAPALIVEGTGATLDGQNKAKSIIYSLPLNASGFNVTSNVTLNSVGEFNIDALIDSVINGILY